MTNEEQIVLDQKSIEQFDPTVAELNELVAKTKDLQATDLKDKVQLELVRTSRIALKKKRVDIEKYAKGLRDNATAWSRKVSEKEKELIGIIEPEEDRLEAIEDEAKKLKIREERLEKLPARKERLASIGDNVPVTDEELLLMDANDFEGYYNARVADKLNADRQEMEAAKAREKAEREAQQREEDELRRKENEAKEAELKKREDEARAKEEENRREEARLQAEKDAREREEKAREEEREKARLAEEKRLEDEKRAKEEAEKKEAEERARLEKAQRYKNWRAQFGYTPENKEDFKEEKVADTIVLWKKVDTFYLNSSPAQEKYDKLKEDLQQEIMQYEICQENPTDTAQFRSGMQKHWEKIETMKNELIELSKAPGIIK